MEESDSLSEQEIEIRMMMAVQRALNTPPMPTKKIIGKSERAKIQRESREIKARRKSPNSP